MSFAGNALPGIVIALSLVFFAARYVPVVYQTLALLVFAYVVDSSRRRCPGVESALERVSPRLEEAAGSLGRGPLDTLREVTVPLARSGVLAGAALVFLSSMKELPATLLLATDRVRHARDRDLETDVVRRVLACGAPRSHPDRRVRAVPATWSLPSDVAG